MTTSESIVKRMSQIHDIYRLVKLTRNISRQLDRKFPPPLTFSGFESRHPATFVVKEKYIKYRPWLTMTDASHVVADSLGKKYLISSTDNIPNSNLPVDSITLTTAGRKLIERTLFIFPTGLWLAWYKEDGKVFVTMFVALMTVLSAVLGLLIKIVFQ